MRVSTEFEGDLLALIDEPLQHAGYYIVQLRLADAHRRGASKSLQLMAERTDGKPMTVKDCETITNTASALLDVHDPIESAYDLEVSSPGLERPLTVLEDFTKFDGSEVVVELTMARDGRKKFKGQISKVDGDDITITKDENEYVLPFASMKQAHLVETEEMIRALLNA